MVGGAVDCHEPLHLHFESEPGVLQLRRSSRQLARRDFTSRRGHFGAYYPAPRGREAIRPDFFRLPKPQAQGLGVGIDQLLK